MAPSKGTCSCRNKNVPFTNTHDTILLSHSMIKKLEIILDLCEFSKKLHKIKEHYSKHHYIFADVSKDNDRIGNVAYFKKTIHKKSFLKDIHF